MLIDFLFNLFFWALLLTVYVWLYSIYKSRQKADKARELEEAKDNIVASGMDQD